MPYQSVSKNVRHSTTLMFDLIADIKNYPDFVPACKKITIIEVINKNENSIIFAKMTVGIGIILEDFTSKITLDKKNKIITVNNHDKLFKKLNNSWSFKENDNGCTVDFTIDFELLHTPISPLITLMFSKVFNKYVSAFEKRADYVYR